MTPEEFIYKIVEAYQKAYDLASEKKDERVKRGKQHSISGIAEDLFAVYLADKIEGADLKFYIDLNISVKLNKDSRAMSFRPDLYILKDEVITHYFDFKTDLGWNRDFTPYLKEKNQRIQDIRGKKCKSKNCNFTISDKVKYQVVLLNGSNGGNTDAHKEAAAKLPGVEMYVLTTGKHPNCKVRKEVNISEEVFNKLIKDTKQLF